MISKVKKLTVYETSGRDPRRNLAAESALFEELEEGELVLYLWQNDHTVVIGRNQNVRRECDLPAMKKDGVILVRRASGGGAVYHDAGNQCFTFLTRDDIYDERRQTEVIRKALAYEGIESEFSGRNDLLADGRKFSGNAYYHHAGASYHHGTLLIHTDLNALGRYLKPDPVKLQRRGVRSVVSRVINLTELKPDLTAEKVRRDLIRALEEEYGQPAVFRKEPDEQRVLEWQRKYSDPHWIYGEKEKETCYMEKRFDWGYAGIALDIKEGVIQKARVDTDAMETSWATALQSSLKEKPFTRGSMREAICELTTDPVRKDLLGWITEEGDDTI